MRLVKGAKETFGWVIVGENNDIIIPKSAWERYGFQVGEEVIITPGSKKSGGFGVTNKNLFSYISIPGFEEKIFTRSLFTQNRGIQLPDNILIKQDDRLLTVYGSGFILGFISKGPIYNFANQHTKFDEVE